MTERKGSIRVETEKPVAYDTVDHQHPRGTKNDNSTDVGFNSRLWALFAGRGLKVLDLGCSGGGFVKSILYEGGLAVGIEGSDYSRIRQRAEWATIPDHLFTADITEPFAVWSGNDELHFDVITAWEVFEHIPEAKLPTLAANIHRHLEPDGLLIVSISTVGDCFEGVEYHCAIRPTEWWLGTLGTLGFHLRSDLVSHFDGHWVRGPNHGEVCSACLVLEGGE